MGDYHPNLNEIRTNELNEIVQNLQKLDFFNAENDDDDIPDESDLAFMSTSNQIDTSWKDIIFEGSSDWNRPENRLPSRLISPEKQDGHCKMLDEYLSSGVIKTSPASACFGVRVGLVAW